MSRALDKAESGVAEVLSEFDDGGKSMQELIEELIKLTLDKE